jgi:endonuclease/exonuclease/phosphatase family metal-dependent hydrolase
MKANYTWLTAVCLVLSVPLIVYLARRNVAGVPTVRFATFNAALVRHESGAMLAELRGGGSADARKVAEIVQRVRPDVLLLNELDRDDAAETAKVFGREYLAVGQNGLEPMDYAYSYCGPVNTGVPSGLDLDGDGKVEGPGDAFGYGVFPGQYGMVLLSRYPILAEHVRTFRELPWSAMPGALRPPGVSDEAWAALRLSSKSHWDVPIGIGTRERGFVVNVLCCHPTPPVFDGPEDQNGRRNHDEIRFWVDYLTPERAGWIADDSGTRGGLEAGARFVLLGDLNCDPVDGDARRDALLRLLAHERVQDPAPKSLGGAEQALKQFGVNTQHEGDPALDTGDFPDAAGSGPGNLRVDYVLPARPFDLAASGVFWPPSHEPAAPLVEVSDHRVVWADVFVE